VDLARWIPNTIAKHSLQYIRQPRRCPVRALLIDSHCDALHKYCTNLAIHQDWAIPGSFAVKSGEIKRQSSLAVDYESMDYE